MIKTYERTIKLYPVFVYGTLLSNEGNNSRFLADSECVGKARLNDRNFKLIGRDKAFPYLVPTEEKQEHPVVGEVYLVTESEIDNLDSLEGTPTHYTRETMPFTVQSCETEIQADCYVYVASEQVQRGCEDFLPVPKNSWKEIKIARLIERAEELIRDAAALKRKAEHMKGL